MSDELGEVYAVDDEIIASIDLPKPCEIRIDISKSDVMLRIGQRDWHWKRGCPDSDGSGTLIDKGGAQ